MTGGDLIIIFAFREDFLFASLLVHCSTLLSIDSVSWIVESTRGRAARRMGQHSLNSLKITSSLIYVPRSSPRLHLIIPSHSIIPRQSQRTKPSSRKNRKERETTNRRIDFPPPSPPVLYAHSTERNAQGDKVGKGQSPSSPRVQAKY